MKLSRRIINPVKLWNLDQFIRVVLFLASDSSFLPVGRMQLLLWYLGALVSRQRVCNWRVLVFIDFSAFRIPTLATELRICNTWNDRSQIFLLVWQTYQLLFGSLLAVDLWDIPPCPSRRCTDKRPCIWPRVLHSICRPRCIFTVTWTCVCNDWFHFSLFYFWLC